MSEENKVAKRRLKNFSFESGGSHVALVGPVVGSAANEYTTLLTKSTKEITDQQVASELALIEKAKLNSQVQQELSAAIKQKFQDDDEWLYLEDFDDVNAFFWRENSLYMVAYSLGQNEEYVIADEAKSVEKEWFYVETGKVVISEQAKDKLEDGEYVLVNKALNNPETNSRVQKALAAFTEKKEKMQEEIQKAVAAKDAEITALQAEIAKSKEELAKVQEIVKAAEDARKAQVLKAREVEVAALIQTGSVELVKSTEALSDEAFAEIVKALKSQKEAVEQSDLMKQVSDPNAEAPQVEEATTAILKAKYAAK